MIKLLRQSNGITGPVVVCDVCGERIKEAKDGHLLWSSPELGNTYMNFITVHKGKCDARRRNEHFWMPLSDMAVNLVRNLHMDYEKSVERADMLAGVTL